MGQNNNWKPGVFIGTLPNHTNHMLAFDCLFLFVGENSILLGLIFNSFSYYLLDIISINRHSDILLFKNEYEEKKPKFAQSQNNSIRGG